MCKNHSMRSATAQHPYLSAPRTPRVLAHRGLVTDELRDAGVAENTRAAFVCASDAGADYIESDCHLTADGAVVLFHDVSLARVTGDPRTVAEVTHAELAEMMEPRGGLLTLTEALTEFPGAHLNLDVKAAAAAEPAGRIVASHASRVLLTSFSEANRRRALSAAVHADVMADRLPATSPGRNRLIGVLLAVASRSSRAVSRAFAGLDALQIPERHGPVRVLTPRLIEAAHERGVEVHVWTINDPLQMVSLVEMGVDGIVTDRADVALDVLG